MRVFNLLLAFGGMSVAGYLGMYEILLEIAMVTIILLDPDIVLGNGSSRPKLLDYLPAWIGDRVIAKRQSLSDVIKSATPARAVSKVILLSIAFGCVLAALWFFTRPWQIVAARELIEIVLDLFIFIAAFFLLRAHFKAFLAAREKTEKEQAAAQQLQEQRDEEVDKAMAEDDPHDGYGPVGSPAESTLGRGLVTMGERLDMLVHWDDIAALGHNYGYWRDDRRAELLTEDRQRWERLRQGLYRVRMTTMLLFCVLPYGLGLAAAWFFGSPDASVIVATHLFGLTT